MALHKMVTIFCILIFLLVPKVFAANWKLVGGDQKEFLFIDYSSLKLLKKGQFIAWTQFVMSNEAIKGNVKSYIEKDIYYCHEGKTKTTSFIAYDKEKNVITSFSNQQNFYEVIPGTYAEYMFNIVCKFKKPVVFFNVPDNPIDAADRAFTATSVPQADPAQ